MTHWECFNKKCGCKCHLEIDGDFTPNNCVKTYDLNAVWQKCEVSQYPKLTAEVFDRPDCPEWANWAAVDADGGTFFYGGIPIKTKELWGRIDLEKMYIGKFDASNWQNSLVERPAAKLPDWCKVGQWVWSDGDYYKVIETGVDWFRTSRNGDTGLWGANILPQFSQARLRPYNAEEMKALVGKVISHQLNAYLCVGFHRGNETVDYGPYRHTEQDLLKTGATIDGKPCGCLEHLENEEWVK